MDDFRFMLGEFFAMLSALTYAIGTVSIVKASATGRGDNGALLSIVLTALLSGVLWLSIGSVPVSALAFPAIEAGFGFFVLSGVLSMIIGRATMFRSTVLAGAINSSLFRRLIPVFAAIFAFVLLGETIALPGLIGMVAIVSSLLVIIREKPAEGEQFSKNAAGVSRRLAVPAPVLAGPVNLRAGRAYGIISSASYGAAIAMRKFGMQYIPDPALGTFIGAITGLVWYALGSIFSKRCRSAVAGLFRDTGLWHVVAAVCISAGQTSQFFALRHTGVAVVATIGSMEVFFSVYLAAYVLKTESPPGSRIVWASVLATAGVILVAVS